MSYILNRFIIELISNPIKICYILESLHRKKSMLVYETVSHYYRINLAVVKRPNYGFSFFIYNAYKKFNIYGSYTSKRLLYAGVLFN